eukprot:779698-Amphidinium_carterae.2
MSAFKKAFLTSVDARTFLPVLSALTVNIRWTRWASVPTVQNVQVSEPSFVPSSIGNLHAPAPANEQYVEGPRSWPESQVQGPEFPGNIERLGLAEWNMFQYADLPMQTARIQSTILQQLMNMARDQEDVSVRGFDDQSVHHIGVYTRVTVVRGNNTSIDKCCAGDEEHPRHDG